MNSDKLIIAIDGYSSSGKSTMAKHLAKAIGYRYIDSGAMYRAVTLFAMRNGWVDASGNLDSAAVEAALPSIAIDFEVTPTAQSTLLNGENVEAEIRSLEVSNCVSPIATVPAVRRALAAMQRAMGLEGGIVMDGRDIGTTVFPEAEMKVFVDAAPEKRAERRYRELLEKGETVSYESVLDNVRSRDRIDETRAESPLRCAPDAVRLDNSGMTLDEQNAWLISLFNSRLASKKAQK